MIIQSGWLLSFGRVLFVSAVCGMLAVLAQNSAFAAEAADGGAALSQEKSVFIVVGAADLAGTITINVMNSAQYKDLKKEVELDNRAMARAFDNLRTDAYNKYAAAYKAEMEKMRQVQQGDQRNRGQQQQTKRTPFQFPLKEPKPRELHFYGSYTDEAAAAEQKRVCEDKEAARLAKIQKAEDDKIKQEQSGFYLKKVIYKKSGDAAPSKELTDTLTAEFERVKKEMVDNPGNASAGKKDFRQAGNAAANAPRKADPSKKLGGEPINTMKSGKKAKGVLGG